MPENILSIYEMQIHNNYYGLCSGCKRPNTCFDWCQNCNSKNPERLKKDFKKWTSGNKFIDESIQGAQLKARNCREFIEWIPYKKLIRNIQHLDQGGFGIVNKAILLDEWNREKRQWKRSFDVLKDEDYENAKQENIKSPLNKYEKHGRHVVLKSLNNSPNTNEDFLNELENHLIYIRSAENNYSSSAIRLYGITRDPEKPNYMIVMARMELGSLRSNLMIKKYNPNDKYRNLYCIAESLSNLHKCNLVHGDFHSGNLLLNDNLTVFISDFGLSRPADRAAKSNDIYGVLPYITPEVLRGQPYTKAADVYSFGIIMWEMTSGVPAFNDFSDDFELSLSICNGLRPKIVKDTEFEYAELMERCWDSDPNKRPTAEELHVHTRSFLDKYYDRCVADYTERIPIPENEYVVQNHYRTTRKIETLECYRISSSKICDKI